MTLSAKIELRRSEIWSWCYWSLLRLAIIKESSKLLTINYSSKSMSSVVNWPIQSSS